MLRRDCPKVAPMAQLTHSSDEEWPATAVATPTTTGSLIDRVRSFLTGPYPTLVSRLALGGIFFLSGLTKLGVPAAFTISINSYEMSLPAALVQAMAVGLPPLEILIGLGLLFGVLTRWMAGASAGLMVVFLIAMIQAAARGLDPNCGCFAGPTGNPLGLQLVRMLGPIGTFLANERVGVVSITRDIIFLLMGLHLLRVQTIWSFDSWRARRAEAAADADPAEAGEADEALPPTH
jgi:uncharacterized membrane protein YphA (DoxX/SURF4 family)